MSAQFNPKEGTIAIPVEERVMAAEMGYKVIELVRQMQLDRMDPENPEHSKFGLPAAILGLYVTALELGTQAGFYPQELVMFNLSVVEKVLGIEPDGPLNIMNGPMSPPTGTLH